MCARKAHGPCSVSTHTSEGTRGSPRGGWPHIPSLLRNSVGPSPIEARLPVPVGPIDHLRVKHQNGSVISYARLGGGVSLGTDHGTTLSPCQESSPESLLMRTFPEKLVVRVTVPAIIYIES